jgi:hypothetical protein
VMREGLARDRYATHGRSIQRPFRYHFGIMSDDDEFDHFPDPFSGVDWDTVPGLSTVPLDSRPDLPTSSGASASVTPRVSTPPANDGSSLSSSEYLSDEVDATFLAEVYNVERRLLQGQGLGSAFSNEDRGEGSSGNELTSRYFHGESTVSMVFLTHDGNRVAR